MGVLGPAFCRRWGVSVQGVGLGCLPGPSSWSYTSETSPRRVRSVLPTPFPWRCCGCSSTAVANPWPGRLTRRWQVLGGGCQRTRWVEWAGATYLCPPWSVRHGRPSTLPLFSSWLLWLLGPIYAFAVFVEPGDVAVMVVESKRAGGLSSNGGLRRL
jgi:hypothetical protein